MPGHVDHLLEGSPGARKYVSPPAGRGLVGVVWEHFRSHYPGKRARTHTEDYQVGRHRSKKGQERGAARC